VLVGECEPHALQQSSLLAGSQEMTAPFASEYRPSICVESRCDAVV